MDRREFLKTTTSSLAAGGLIGCSSPTPTSPEEASSQTGSPDFATTNDNSEKPEAPQTYPFYRAAGSHRELGQQHGQQAAGHIHQHLDSMLRDLKLSREELQTRAMTFQPLFDKHCPHLVEEIQGLAEGAKIKFAEALACNIRGVLDFSESGGCTTYVIGSKGTAKGEVLVRQNSDVFQEHTKLGYRQ